MLPQTLEFRCRCFDLKNDFYLIYFERKIVDFTEVRALKFVFSRKDLNT